MHLNRLQRLGVVISVLWAIGAAYHIHDEQRRAAQGNLGLALYRCTDPDQDTNILRIVDCQGKARDAFSKEMRGVWLESFLLAVIPIPILWLSAYLVIWVGKWVWRGSPLKSSN